MSFLADIFTFRASQSSSSSISGMLLPCVADGIWDVKGLFLVLALHLSVIPAWSHHGKGFPPQSSPSLRSRILFLLGLWWEKGIFLLSSSSICWGFSWHRYLKCRLSSNLIPSNDPLSLIFLPCNYYHEIWYSLLFEL